MTITQDLPNNAVMGSLSPWLWRKVYITELLTERSLASKVKTGCIRGGRKGMDHTEHAESNWFCNKEFHQQEDFEALILTRFCFRTTLEFSPLSNGPKNTASCIILISSLIQGCQFRFGRCFILSIGMECFSFEVFRRAVSGLYCSYIYIYIYIYIPQT